MLFDTKKITCDSQNKSCAEHVGPLSLYFISLEDKGLRQIYPLERGSDLVATIEDNNILLFCKFP